MQRASDFRVTHASRVPAWASRQSLRVQDARAPKRPARRRTQHARRARYPSQFAITSNCPADIWPHRHPYLTPLRNGNFVHLRWFFANIHATQPSNHHANHPKNINFSALLKAAVSIEIVEISHDKRPLESRFMRTLQRGASKALFKWAFDDAPIEDASKMRPFLLLKYGRMECASFQLFPVTRKSSPP